MTEEIETEPGCVEDAALAAIVEAKKQVNTAIGSLADWRHIYASRLFISKRSGDHESTALASECYDKIWKLSNRAGTIYKKLDELEILFAQTEKEING